MFESAQISRRGGRETNQDAVWMGEATGWYCWALADGLGGMGGGELAAQAAVAAFAGVVGGELERMAEAAQSAVLAQQKAQPEFASMRTTLVVLVSDGRNARWMHCGDSRLYRFRGGRVVDQTLDHSVPQTLVDAGRIEPAEIRQHPDRNRLLRSLGSVEAGMEMSPAWRDVLEGDAYLLASDGFWEWITEREMETELAKAESAAAWLRGMELRVVERVVKLEGNSVDNYSAIAIWRVGQ